MGDNPKDAAQAALDRCSIKAGDIYRHYKGGLYSIVCTAIDEATLEPMVIYRSNSKGTTWARTLAVFTSLADTDTTYVLPDGSTQQGRTRFSRVLD